MLSAWIVPALLAIGLMGAIAWANQAGPPTGSDWFSVGAQRDLEDPKAVPWHESLPPGVLLFSLCLVALSAFFSGSETAFFSIPRYRLRTLREEARLSSRLIVALLDHPGRLLTTILVGNMLVNTVIGVVLGTRIKDFLEYTIRMPNAESYTGAVFATTASLLLFGEIAPKIIAVRLRETFARSAVMPLTVADRVLSPLRKALLGVVDLIFKASRLSELRAAPYITDDELKSVLSNGAGADAAENEGREMIRRILEFRDVTLREILVPRPDVVALPADATVAQARDLFREHEYSRIPLYWDDLDHIEGVVFAKDLLPSLTKGEIDVPVRSLVRKAHYVPETMSVQDFVRDAQRTRTHLAIVVDEYGGTEGIVTLEDGIEQVVGDILDENEEERPAYTQLAEHVWRLRGSCPLDKLEELARIALEDEEHETVAGFLMNTSDKVLDVGDCVRHRGMLFTVESVDGKRVDSVRMEIVPEAEEASPK